MQTTGRTKVRFFFILNVAQSQSRAEVHLNAQSRHQPNVYEHNLNVNAFCPAHMH